MAKRGQLTFFIILGIIILFCVSLLFVINTTNTSNSFDQTPLFATNINSYVSSCMETTAVQGLVALGLRGGYYQPKQMLAGQTILEVPYYFYNGEKEVPDKDQIGRELSYFMSLNIDGCINNFESFKDEKYKIINYGYKTKFFTSFENGKVIIQADYPVDVSADNKIISLKKFEKEIPFDFEKVYNITSEIVSEQEANPDYMPIGKISELAEKNNFTFETITYEENTILYELKFNSSEKISPYIMAFAVKYNWTDTDMLGNRTGGIKT